MTTRAGLTDKDNTSIRSTAPSDESKAASIAPQEPETLEEAMKNLDDIGIYLSYSTASQKSLRALNKIDPDLFAQVIASLRQSTPGAIAIWKNHFRNVTSSDAHHHPINAERYRRMIANTELTANLLSTLGVGTIIKSPAIFQASNIAIAAETDASLIPGDKRYVEVHAIMIHCAIVTPELFTKVNSGIRRIKPSAEDIACIVENYDEVLRLLPELVKRQDASHEMITSLLSVNRTLADGAL